MVRDNAIINCVNPSLSDADNRKSSTANYVKNEGEAWTPRKSSRSDELNRWSMYFYVFVKDDLSRVVENDIYVSCDGSDEIGDGSKDNPYKTITYANETIKNSDFFNRYVIHVADGFYDELNPDAGGTKYDKNGILMKDYVTYEGNCEHPENCVLYVDGTQITLADDAEPTWSDVGNIAIFHYIYALCKNTLGVNSSIKGFKLRGKNLRYLVHIDASGHGIGGNYLFENCIFNHLRSPETDSSSKRHWPIGMGVAPYEITTFKDCEFQSEQTFNNGTAYNACYYMHNNLANVTPLSYYNEGTLIFDNCNFNGGQFLFSSLEKGHSQSEN